VPRKAPLPAFAGWDVPHTTQVPDMLFDELLPDLSGAELKVLLYIIRRTFGFKKHADAISLSQLKDGIRKADGTVLDRGTGLAESTVLEALKSLETAGYISKESTQSPDGVNYTNVYSLRFRADAAVPRFSRDGGPKICAAVPRESGTQQTAPTYSENGSETLRRVPFDATVRQLARSKGWPAPTPAELARVPVMDLTALRAAFATARTWAELIREVQP
jgi:hypothetical protein